MIMIFSVGFAFAEDANQTDSTFGVTNDTVISEGGSSNYGDLQNEFPSGVSGTVNLAANYTFDETKDKYKQVEITGSPGKKIVINGTNHVIDGNGKAGALKISNAAVTINDLVFKNSAISSIIVSNSTLMEQMKRLLNCIQEEYDYPVDTEFTINISESGEYSIDLLQCRPLQIQKGKSGTVIPPNVDEKDILLESKGASTGMCKTTDLDIIVYVDPVKYYNMPYNDKSLIAKLVGKINWFYRDKGKHMMLIVPGRVGTSSPELGLPTSFSDISTYEIICETEETKAGFNPELSYGSHIFQDLVEAEILYTAIFNNEKTIHFSPEKLESSKDIVSEFEESEKLTDIVHVYDVSDRKCKVYNDVANEHLMITC